jgi:hypothetical protein
LQAWRAEWSGDGAWYVFGVWRPTFVGPLRAEQEAVEVAEKAAAAPPHARAATKRSLREELATAWAAYYPGEADAVGWAYLTKPETIAVLGAAMRRLSSKPAGGKDDGSGARPAAKM